MKTLVFHVDKSRARVSVRRAVIAGFTGRDLRSVRKHIVELQEHGVECPSTVPEFYGVDPTYLSQTGKISVDTRAASGEVEPVLIFQTDYLEDALVTVASDLTDREAEKASIAQSKRMAKPISNEGWNYARVAENWDSITLRSWITRDGRLQVYQEGILKQLLRPDDLISRLTEQNACSLSGTVLFMGTIPVLNNGFLFSNYFCGELVALSGQYLRCEYSVSVIK